MGAPRRFDVLVAGGGLVGLALAPALARAGLRVAIADRQDFAPQVHDAQSWDARVYAISPGSVRFLAGLGAWPPLRAEAVEAMRIAGDGGALLEFSAYELGERALAWIAEERELRAALLPRLAEAGVHAIPGATFASLAFDAGGARLALGDGSTLEAALVVAADGLRSWVREAAGLAAVPRPYGQTAVVANFDCGEAHRGIARQWFLGRDGILAWLPLPGRRISIVWSAPEPLAAELLALDTGALAHRVAGAGANALGDLAALAPAAGFPLQFLRVAAPIAHRLALVGDAAHGVHPLAGQGVNLGFGDAEALARVLAERGPVTDPGAPVLLARHARLRAEPVLAMQAVTDGLARLFGSDRRWVARLRNAGLAAVGRLDPVRRLLAQPALR